MDGTGQLTCAQAVNGECAVAASRRRDAPEVLRPPSLCSWPCDGIDTPMMIAHGPRHFCLPKRTSISMINPGRYCALIGLTGRLNQCYQFHLLNRRNVASWNRFVASFECGTACGIEERRVRWCHDLPQSAQVRMNACGLLCVPWHR